MQISFLNLSDLHFSKNKMADTKIVLNALFEDLKKCEEKIEFILFNGDLINNGSMGFEKDNEYELVLEHFINPLLTKLELDKNRIFFVPGNHDVNRSKINDRLYGNISEKFSNRDDLNSFIDEMDNYGPLFERLEDFSTFLDIFYDSKNIHEIRKNHLFSTNILNLDEKKIGVACLNSSWAAFGGDEDYGKLMVGERQIDMAGSDLEDCDLKIAMIHHPLDWLKEFDRNAIKTQLMSKFDLIYTGHVHTQDTHQIIQGTSKSVFYQCGALFDGRFFNGYAITTYDFHTNEVTLKLREYYDRRRVFDKALNIVADGKASFFLQDDGRIEVIKKNMEIRNKMKDQVLNHLNKGLISVLSHHTNAPKTLSDIYVPNLISNTPEKHDESMEEEFFEVDSLLQKQKNLLFVGKKELGKTTMLKYICYKYMISNELQTKIPIIINFNELSKGKNIIKKAISSHLFDFSAEQVDIEQALIEGDLILLVDNLQIDDLTKIGKIKEFSKEYPKVRFIFTMEEDLLETIKLKEFPELGMEYEIYYIYPYRRSQTRELIKKWFNYGVNDDEILDRIIRTIKTVGLPRSPLAISLLLSIIEKQANYVPINEASLVDRFTEDLLDKLHVDEVKYETFDYVIKSDYLSYLAYVMVKKDKYYLENMEFQEETINYFKEKGLETNLHLFENLFFDKGILTRENGKVFFRLQCFYELFLAKYMILEENKGFKEYILGENNYLQFQNEIVYLSGLQRRNKNLIELLEKRLLKASKNIEDEIIDEFSQLPIEELLTNKLRSDDLVEKLNKINITAKEKDEIFDESDSKTVPAEKAVSQKRIKIKDNGAEFIQILNLYAQVLKNSELLNATKKTKALNTIINRYCKLIAVFYSDILTKIGEDKKILDEEDILSKYQYVMTTGLPLIFQGIILNTLGTPKLKSVIEQAFDNTNQNFEKFMLLMLYSDLRLERYIQKLDSFLSNNNSIVIKEVALLKLLYYRYFYLKSETENQKINNIIADIVVDKGIITKREKSLYIRRLNKQANIKKITEAEDII
ncbi:metallophosphoesterase family protein [Heyndrickxia ginsengihumi]|uniref:metallophosphoesterase family protein n=1 Tax=Heyndrickxia ginsengihumi TaxID=363870 RepID=UPI000472081C|nr:metallophosphoesterase [Heyndrickxia ginsengihumi]